MRQRLESVCETLRIWIVTVTTRSSLRRSFIQILVRLLNILNQPLQIPPIITIRLPIRHTPHLPPQPKCTTRLDLRLTRPLHTIPQHPLRLPFLTDTTIDLLEIDTVLHRAGLDQIPVRNVMVVVDYAVCEAEGEFGVRVEL